MFVRDYLTLDDVVLTGKRVLLRADLNVPVKGGKITDLTRLERLKPTLSYLHKHGATIILLSHFGRPDGKPMPEYSLQPVAAELSTTFH